MWCKIPPITEDFLIPWNPLEWDLTFYGENDNFLLITHHLGAYPSIWISWYLKQNEKQNRTRITIPLPTPYFILVQPSDMKRYWWWCFFFKGKYAKKHKRHIWKVYSMTSSWFPFLGAAENQQKFWKIHLQKKT